MSLSFLGTTSQRASKIVFIVDVGSDLLDIRKGGFDAFKIIREEIMKLISRLPPSAEFGVVLYERGRWNNNAVPSLGAKLLPATVANKQAAFDWINPINATPDKLGLASVAGNRVNWTARTLSNAGLDPDLNTSEWIRALHFALEMEPDTVFIIAGAQGGATRNISAEELARRRSAQDKKNAEREAELKRAGIDINAVNAARKRAFDKAREQLDAINAKLRAQGKPPFIVTNINRIFADDFKAALKKAGFPPITLDKTGWTDKDGNPIVGAIGVAGTEAVEFKEIVFHVAKLQRALLKDRAALNYFLFVGPEENPQSAVENLSMLTQRNGGKFELLTTKRLQEINNRNDPKS